MKSDRRQRKHGDLVKDGQMGNKNQTGAMTFAAINSAKAARRKEGKEEEVGRVYKRQSWQRTAGEGRSTEEAVL